MAHTYLVAAFDHSNEAEQVRRELMGLGVSQTNIKLTASNDDNISGFFRSIFTDANSQRNAEAYSQAVRHGATVVTVFAAEEQASMVEKIMESNGAIDINERSARWEHSESGERTAIPVVEEELKVGKRENTLGSVRVTSHISERPVEEKVNLTEQHVVIERHPVDRPASPEDLAAFREGTIELQETAEEAVVSKSARVVEEVVLGRETIQHEETIRDTVRRTDVNIEQTGSASAHGASARVSRHEAHSGDTSARAEQDASAAVQGAREGSISTSGAHQGGAAAQAEQGASGAAHGEKGGSASVSGSHKGGVSMQAEQGASGAAHGEKGGSASTSGSHKGGASVQTEQGASGAAHGEKGGSASASGAHKGGASAQAEKGASGTARGEKKGSISESGARKGGASAQAGKGASAHEEKKGRASRTEGRKG